jgi:hypothetical protein
MPRTALRHSKEPLEVQAMNTATPDLTLDLVDDIIPQTVRNLARKDIMNRQIDVLVETVSSPGFIGFVNDIGKLPTHDERREFTAEYASLETLRERGVDTPRGLRFTTREFEPPEDGRASDTPLMRIDPKLDPRMGFCISVGAIFCISFGA